MSEKIKKPVITLPHGTICRGSITLGTGCMKCEKCLQEWERIHKEDKDVEFLKMGCLYAEGFKWYDTDIIDPTGTYHRPRMFMKNPILYPFFLQEVIQGINKDYLRHPSLKLPIMIDELGVHISSKWHDIFRSWGSSPNINVSKRTAIEFIFEWEKMKIVDTTSMCITCDGKGYTESPVNHYKGLMGYVKHKCEDCRGSGYTSLAGKGKNERN